MAEPLFVGVDVGGTKVAAGLVNAAGDIVSRTRVPMNPQGTADDAAQAVFVAIDAAVKVIDKASIQGIGLSAPGPLDPRSGVIINPPNLTYWRNFPLAEVVRNRYPYPVRVDNDANAGGLAEAIWGAGKGYSSVFYATIGTGIGTGIIFDRKLYLGRTGAAGEGGHVTIDYRGPICGCGKPGCIETLASGTAIARRARARVKKGSGADRLLSLADGRAENITTEMVAEAWREGDMMATEILRETVELLTIWLGNMIDVLDPDVIVVGGGVSTILIDWFPEMKAMLPRWCINSRCSEIPVFQAKFGVESGIVGAASLCFDANAERHHTLDFHARTD